MKTAISIPGPLFEEAEQLAKRRGMSRSELYSRAVSEYVESQRFVGVRERLDAVYAAAPAESELDTGIAQAQAHSLPFRGLIAQAAEPADSEFDPDVAQAQTNSLTNERW